MTFQDGRRGIPGRRGCIAGYGRAPQYGSPAVVYLAVQSPGACPRTGRPAYQGSFLCHRIAPGRRGVGFQNGAEGRDFYKPPKISIVFMLLFEGTACRKAGGHASPLCPEANSGGDDMRPSGRGRDARPANPLLRAAPSGPHKEEAMPNPQTFMEDDMDNPIWPDEDHKLAWDACMAELTDELEGAASDCWLEFRATRQATHGPVPVVEAE